MGIILKENNLVHTKIRHKKLLGSSCYEFDKVTNRVIKNEKLEELPFDLDNVEYCGSFDGILEYYGAKNYNEVLGRKDVEIKEKQERKPKKEEYKLNKKKVREKCSAFFGLKASLSFLAFYSISYPFGMSDNSSMICLNKWLTRCRKKFRLKSYLWVAERQRNGTLHFHMLTNSYMPIYLVNRYMAVAIDNQLKKEKQTLGGLEYTDKKGNKQITKDFNVEKYNGVDVERCNNNRKKLIAYLTKYISKNDITFFRLPYHSSRDISRLFTAETFTSFFDSDFMQIRKTLKHVVTSVVDSEYGSVEYMNIKQSNDKYFVPPLKWYQLLNDANECVYAMVNNPIFKNTKSMPIN